MTNADFQTIPCSKESEMMVLGCMLTSTDFQRIGVKILKDDDFFLNEHQHIFEAVQKAEIQGIPADIHLIAEALKENNKLDISEGVSYLTSLAQYAGTSAHFEEYANRIKSKAYARKTIFNLQDAIQKLLSDGGTPFSVIGHLKEKGQKLDQRYAEQEEIFTIKDVILGRNSQEKKTFMELLNEKYLYFKEHKQPKTHGQSIGFRDLDQQTLLLREANLIAIGARPSFGKTALALTILSYWLDSSFSAALFSLEMGPHQILERLISIRTEIAGEKIQRGDLSEWEMEQINQCIESLSSKKLFIQDQGCASIEKICLRARELKEKHNIGLIVVDYMQLIISEKSSSNRQYEMAYISRELKLLAMELNIPIICVAQLSRKVDDRQGHVPILSDLRDSGQIEQDCDVILFIHRREMYDKYDKPGIAELMVSKNRHGPRFNACLGFHAPTGKFFDLPLEQAANLQLQPQTPPAKVSSPKNKKSKPRKNKSFDEFDDSDFNDD